MEVAKATAELEAARAYMSEVVNLTWYAADEGEAPTIDDRVGLRLAATHAARTAADVVDRMYDLGGGSSIYESSKLQRNFRDIHAATQHLVVSPATYELTGRLLLGVVTVGAVLLILHWSNPPGPSDGAARRSIRTPPPRRSSPTGRTG